METSEHQTGNVHLNKIVVGDNVAVCKTIPPNSIDLVVTSPPYGCLRDYNGFSWDFKGLSAELARVLVPGGVIVWNECDQVVDGGESCDSFRHALGFTELGLKLFDTMIYERAGVAFPSQGRYTQMFEYMFVLSKGKPKTFNPIKDVPKLWEGSWGKHTARGKDGVLVETQTATNGLAKSGRAVGSEYGFKQRGNIWRYANGKGFGTRDTVAYAHPARFPEKLAADHIVTWSNPGDTVLDPFNGSGTTSKMAFVNNRNYIGIDISEEYCEIARTRIKHVSCAQRTLLTHTQDAQSRHPQQLYLHSGTHIV